MGKTLIDTDVRNNVLEFLREVANEAEPVGLLTIKARAKDLYWDLKPQRVRSRIKKVEEVVPVVDIQPSI